jgi:Leucine-rich repeat (LRR) protein
METETKARYIHFSHSRINNFWQPVIPGGVLRVDLSFCNLFVLPKSLSLPETLRELWLNDNPLTTLAGSETWHLPELHVLEISRTEIPKIPGELAFNAPGLRIIAEDCKLLKPGHEDSAFLRTKKQRHELLAALTERLTSGLYAVEDPKVVVELVKTIGRATKRDFAIGDYRRLLHSSDRFFTERIQDNSAEKVNHKMRAYKGGSPHSPRVDQAKVAVKKAALVVEPIAPSIVVEQDTFAVFDTPIVLKGQRPLWQSLVSL